MPWSKRWEEGGLVPTLSGTILAEPSAMELAGWNTVGTISLPLRSA